MQHPESISLKDLLLAVRQELYQTFDRGYWIRSEISEIRENTNGHCYLELVEKDSSEKLIVAKTESIQSAKRVEELYINALNAMRTYTGSPGGEEDD